MLYISIYMSVKHEQHHSSLQTAVQKRLLKRIKPHRGLQQISLHNWGEVRNCNQMSQMVCETEPVLRNGPENGRHFKKTPKKNITGDWHLFIAFYHRLTSTYQTVLESQVPKSVKRRA